MRKIGICSAAPGAGAKFTAAALACYLAAAEKKDPAVLELGEPGLYDCLGMDKRFAGRRFYPRGGPANRAAGVNWQLLTPAPAAEPRAPRGRFAEGAASEFAGRAPGGGPMAESAAERLHRNLRILDRTEGDVVLCLLNGLPEEEKKLFFREMDRLLCVIDPLPSALLQSYDFLQSMSRLQPEPVFLVNKMNPGVRRRELLQSLGGREPLFLPLLPAEELYRAQYACRCPYEQPAAARRLRPALSRLYAQLLAE